MSNAMKVILLIDDNPDDIALALHALRRSRVMNPVVVVHDGVEALDFLFARGAYSARAGAPLPMIAILDLHLPKLDGLAVLKAIRTDPRTYLLPVIILTSSMEEDDLISGHSLAAARYLRKPVDFGVLVEALKALGSYWLMINERPQETTDP